MSALDLTLCGQAGAVASGEANAGELLEETLARIESRNPALNAIVETFPERSREMLAAAPKGPLHGVPVAIKDEWPLPWRAERLGAADPLAARLEAGESGPYRALRDAGAVIVGVANMHEYGASSTGNLSVYGAAHNPWDTSRCPGGSSSGPGAAVGGRLVAGAVGADGIGSIRYPAAYCGVTGLKPTFGRSAMEGHHLPQTTTIVSGPLCRDAADCRLLAGVLFGEELDAGDPGGLRIGTVAGDLWDDCDPEVRAACQSALEALKSETGASATEVELERGDLYALASVLVGQTEDLGDLTPQRVAELPEAVSLLARALLRYRLMVPGAAIARAQRVRTLARHSLAAAFERVDVLAWPTVPAPAPPLDEPTVELPSGVWPADTVNPRQAGIANLTGVPGISIPVGFSSEGLPIGLQLLAAWGRDELLLDCAEAIERASAREWVDAAPSLAEA
jgi:Asp-tRNA(Asn)/Glu-tRNA(Gln) amidotransferase A subunit family amidase